MKKANYFPQYVDDDHTPKSSEILMNYGNAGYAIYQRLQMRLLASKTRTLDLDKLPAIAYDMHTDVKELKAIVENYFNIDDNTSTFYLEDLNERMAWYDEKYQTASDGGKKAAETLTPEQRKERAKKGASKRWEKKQEADLKAEVDEQIHAQKSYDMLSASNEILTTKQEIPAPLASDAYNRIRIGIESEFESEQKRIESESEPEQNRKELEQEFEPEQNRKKLEQESSFDLGSHSSNQDEYSDLTQCQDEVDNYSSKLFQVKHYNFVTENYLKLKKTIPRSEVSLAEYERMLFHYIYNVGIFEGINVNDYITKYKPTIDPNTIQIYIKHLKDEEFKTNYLDVINTYSTITAA